ncbi:hypothetical protein HOY80DRAFT_73995 [Tuber brumale]|nr:hypothetical protein HOY80DRAFT_73995 [Tuber brumale]
MGNVFVPHECAIVWGGVGHRGIRLDLFGFGYGLVGYVGLGVYRAEMKPRRRTHGPSTLRWTIVEGKAENGAGQTEPKKKRRKKQTFCLAFFFFLFFFVSPPPFPFIPSRDPSNA